MALQRLKALCDNKFISVHFFSTNPTAVFAAHENASIVDGAMATKMTVQFNLFGGTVKIQFTRSMATWWRTPALSKLSLIIS